MILNIASIFVPLFLDMVLKVLARSDEASPLSAPVSSSSLSFDESSVKMFLQPSERKGLEKSAVLQRLFLVATLDGTLTAFDKYSGALYWENKGLGGALIKGALSKSPEHLPLYMFEPIGSASMYAYLSGRGIQKLPINLKLLVEQSPVRWPDGTFFIGQKSTNFYALDLMTGEIVYQYGTAPDAAQTCPSDDILEAFSGNSMSLILLSRTSYTLSCLQPNTNTEQESQDFLTAGWNVTFSEYTGFTNPFSSDDREGKTSFKTFNNKKKSSNDEFAMHSSSNGIIIVRDKKTEQILWARQMPSVASAFFELDSGDKDQLGPLLDEIPIAPAFAGANDLKQLASEADIREIPIHLGSLGEIIYVLPKKYFPMVKNVFDQESGKEKEEDKRGKEELRLLKSDKKLDDNGADNTGGLVDIYSTDFGISNKRPRGMDKNSTVLSLLVSPTCRPGQPDFPDCLKGNRMATVLRPIPLLKGPGEATSEAKDQKMILSVFVGVLVVAISMLLMYWRQYRERNGRQRRIMHIGRDSRDLRPPGFEEISLNSADILYTAQEEINGLTTHPKSFIISDEIIGYGSHGTVVFKGSYDGRPVAVKRMLIDFYEIAGHEVNLLQHSDHHPNVIRYFCREKTEKFTYIVLELCECSLAELIEDRTGKYKERFEGMLENKKALLEQIAAGLAHLHELNLIHRDIKPHNILISDKQKRPVLSDFGVSKRLSEDQTSFQPTMQTGTIGWRAPECILSEESRQLSVLGNDTSTPVVLKVSKSIDVFALGCVFYYVLTDGDHPFGGRLEREANIVKNRVDMSKLDDIPVAADLIARMIDRRAEKRPSCAQILQHPYFWSAQKQISFLLDVSDRLEYEDRLVHSEILKKLESRRQVIFEGNLVWHKLIDSEVWLDLCNYRKYNGHSARDLLRALRNKRNHFHELPLELKKILGETPEAFMQYFLKRFPRLLIEIYRLVESTFMRKDNPFALVYFGENI